MPPQASLEGSAWRGDINNVSGPHLFLVFIVGSYNSCFYWWDYIIALLRLKNSFYFSYVNVCGGCLSQAPMEARDVLACCGAGVSARSVYSVVGSLLCHLQPFRSSVKV